MLLPVAVLAAMIELVVGSIFVFSIATERCVYNTIDSLPSPTGKLSIARVERSCTYDEADEPVMFALIREGERFEKRNVFLSTDQYQGLRWGALGVFAKWIDNDDLLVAAPEGAVLKAAPIEISGVHVQYGVYPIDSGSTRDGSSVRGIKRNVDFETRYEMNNGIGLPGAGCSLEVSA
jgi:hypothetical protein